MRAWGRTVAQYARSILIAGVLLIVAMAVYGVGVFSSLSNGGFEDKASQSHQAWELQKQYAPTTEIDVVAVYSSPTLTADSPEFATKVKESLQKIPAGTTTKVTSWYATKAPPLLSSDKKATRVLISLAGSDETAKATSMDAVLPALQSTDLTTDIGGAVMMDRNINDQVSKDIARAEGIAMPIVFILSLLIFGSFAAALMPTLVGGIAVFGAFAVVRALTNLTDISIFSINVITLMGMGLAIDYALFIVNRFREELAKQPDSKRENVRTAVQRTIMTAGRTVMFSALIVAGSMASLLIFPQTFLRSMGLGGIAAVLVAMVTALTVLPALLGVLGHRIEWGTMPWRRRAVAEKRAHADRDGAWAKVAHSVMRRPVMYLVIITLGLLAMATPFLSSRWGSVDERVLPTTSSARQAADIQRERFDGEKSTAMVVVKNASTTQLAAYVKQVNELPGVTSVQPGQPVQTGEDHSHFVTVEWDGASQSEQSQELVKKIRTVAAESNLTTLVSGRTAYTVDMISSISSKLGWMALIVGLVMLVLLFIAFGSVVLPFKAIVMAVLSITASFGVVTWIFQDGHLSQWLDFTSTGYLDLTQPILMLAILFGLSMDYEVFLLSRVREEWDATGDNTAAVASGIQRTGRIITSAALLLSIVIAGFAASGIVFIKMIGVGMLVALAIDATIVRALLVPATMRLLGRVNWWAPAPLARWWQRYGHHEEIDVAGNTNSAGQGKTSAVPAESTIDPAAVS